MIIQLNPTNQLTIFIGSVMMMTMKKKDLTGLKFNRVTALKFIGKYKSYTSAWECLCECGKVFITYGYALETGHTKSCGCLVFDYNSLVGKEHTFCEILKKVKSRVKGNNALYECKCKLCGRIFQKNSSWLSNKKFKSCGCKNKLIKQPPGMASAKDIYQGYLRNAKKRNIEFNINFENFVEICIKECFYCGSAPRQLSKISKNGEFYYNGIDRLDNSKGYNKENIVTCCGICNRMKLDLPFNNFINLIKKINERIENGTIKINGMEQTSTI